MSTFIAASRPSAASGTYLSLGIMTPANYLTASPGSGYTASPTGPVASSGFAAANLGLPISAPS